MSHPGGGIRSLASLLTAPLLVVYVVLSVLLLWSVPAQQQEQVARQLGREASGIATSIAVGARIAFDSEDMRGLDRLGAVVERNRDISVAGIYMEVGQGSSQVVAAYPSAEAFSRAVEDPDYLFETSSFVTALGAGEVRVGYAAERIDLRIQALRQPLYLAFVGLLVALLFLHRFVLFVAARPMALAAEFAARITRGEASRGAETQLDDRVPNAALEARQLFSALQDLRDRLGGERARNAELLASLEMRVSERTRELAQNDQRLRGTLERLGLVMNAARCMSWEYDHEAGAIAVIGTSVMAEGEFRVDIADLGDWLHQDDVDEARARLREAHFSGAATEFYCRVKVDRDYRWFMVIAAERAPDSEWSRSRTVGALLDVQDRVDGEQQIWQMSHIDPLTGLLNRASFTDAFQERAASGSFDRLTLVVFDVEGLRDINERHGTSVGDEVLRRIAVIMRSIAEDGDLLARLDGDSFGLVRSGGVSDEQLDATSERIAELVRASDTPRFALLAGVATFPEDGATLVQLLVAAEEAALYSKELHDSALRWQRFDAHRSVERRRRGDIARMLESAIANGSIEAWFQPIWDVENARVMSCEALMRWPSGPDVSVETIVSVAEETGLVLELGEYMIDASCRLIASMDPDSLTTVAVNVSSIQMQRQQLLDVIVRATRRHAVDPARLVVELTESSFLGDLEDTQRIIADLKAEGISVAIDDFGTGYSSLSYLHSLDVDWVKIDKSFVLKLSEDRSSQEIVNAIVQMAHSMRLRLVAEGVSSEADYELLRRLGCERVQGYLVARPMPAEALIEFLGHPVELYA